MGSNNPEWCVNIKANENNFIRKLKATRVEEHPLKTIVVTDRIPRRILGSQSSTGFSTPLSTPTSFFDINEALEGIDPLTKFAREEMDPLTLMATESAKVQNDENKKVTKSVNKSKFQPWDLRKAGILNQFTTSEKITIVTSFLNEDEQVIVKAQTSSIDKVHHRLEQLDYFAEGSQKKFDLSQVEYIRQIEQLNKELVRAWNSEQRVKALKIAIQCAKMLSDTDVLQFYPSKFVLITDILDCFGRLVYERLRTKADDVKPGTAVPLPEDFMPNMVPEQVKETCRNWFYKIASIRELVPRIYVEMAILKSYSFLTLSEYSSALMRLTRMIRGIGNPLVSIYARCYLCRVGLTITSFIKDSKYLVENFYDFLIIYDHLFTNRIKNDIKKQKLDTSSYLTLYTPALEFILEAAVAEASENLLTEILQKCQFQGNSSLLLNTSMAVFKPSYVSLRTVQFLDMITKSTDHGLSLHVLLRTLGLCITVSPPPVNDRKTILRNVWKLISRIENPEHYLNCAEPWTQFAVQYFMNRTNEVNLILGDIIRHMAPDRNHENFYPQLKLIVEKIMMHTQDIEALISMDKFLPLIDLFQQETIRVEICKTILTTCINENEIIDPVIISTLIFLCGVLHDSVTALTIEDEYRQISDIICAILRKINYGQDFEQQLSFYVDARGAFSNLFPVLTQLVHSVNSLAVKVRGIVNGNHTRKTGAFVRACAAYCFITIPSIASMKTRLDLYLITGQVALFNNCLGQADAFFKAALTNFSEISESPQEDINENYLISYIRKFLSTLLVVPDSPEKPVLSLTRVLLNVIKNHKWNQQTTLPELYVNVMEMLSVMAQDKYPYYVDKIDSNDAMYGSDPKFIAEINKICTIVLTELLVKLKEFGPGRAQSILVLKLFEAFLNRVELNSSVLTFVYNLWQLSIKYGHGDIKLMSRTHQYYKSRSITGDNKLFEQLMMKINVPF